MTIGLVLLAVVAILIFFGLSDKFFKNVGVSPWVGFVLAMLLIIGAVIPNVTVGEGFVFNFGGFVVPIIGMIVLMAYIGWNRTLLKVVFAELVIAAIAIATRVLILPETTGMILAASLIVGFVGGAVAFLINGSRLGTLASVMGGIVLGDLIVNLIYVFGIGGYVFSMGTRGVFDSIIIACVFGILLLEAVVTARRTASNNRVAHSSMNAESADDIGKDEFNDYFDDTIL